MFAGQPRIISSNYLEDEKYNPGVVLSRPRDATAAAVQRLRCRVADGLLLPRPEVLAQRLRRGVISGALSVAVRPTQGVLRGRARGGLGGGGLLVA